MVIACYGAPGEEDSPSRRTPEAGMRIKTVRLRGGKLSVTPPTGHGPGLPVYGSRRGSRSRGFGLAQSPSAGTARRARRPRRQFN